jgi:hypothetical protein
VGWAAEAELGRRKERWRGEKNTGWLWPAGRIGGGGPLGEKMIFQISFSNKFQIPFEQENDFF